MIDALHEALRWNEALYRVIQACEALELGNYYIGAGCVAQTVWNRQCGNPPLTGIGDIDFVYYDPDTSYEAEDAVIRRVREHLSDAPLPVDVKNQARVHLWYRARFGTDIEPFVSTEAAIDTWPTTATSVGVRLEAGQLRVYAPFGLEDLFAQVIRPNRAKVTEAVYREKAAKWLSKWPSLRVMPW